MKKPTTKPIYIPIDISLQSLDASEIDELGKDDDFKKIAMEEIEKILVYLSETKENEITVFTISNLGIKISIPRTGYKKALAKLIEYHQVKENYKKCSELTKLKSKL